MEADKPTKSPILEVAWTRYAQLDKASLQRTKPNFGLRRWILILGVLATLLAILTQLYKDVLSPVAALALQIALIAAPIIGSVLAAYTKQFYAGGDYLTLRAGAEEILKEIYIFRTILRKKSERRVWLEKRLAEIQRQVYRGLGGEMVFKDFPDQIPPYYNPENPASDSGFGDLTGEQYFRYRLENQLAWHMVKINQVNGQRRGLQIIILLAGAAGAFLAAMGTFEGAFSIWVALTSTLAAALISWQELRNQDFVVKNYSKVIMELGIIYDHWTGLETEERSESEFFRMVQATEDILWGQNVEYIKSMQEALVKLTLDDEADLVLDTLRQARESDARMKKMMRESISEITGKAVKQTEGAVTSTFQDAIGSLAEEANSELVLQELEAMGKAVAEKVEEVKRSLRLSDSLEKIASEFKHVEIGKSTPSKVLFDMISLYPKNEEVKG